MAELLPRLESGSHSGCLNCGPHPTDFPMDGRIAVGFGDASLLKDGVAVWSESYNLDWEECMTGQQAEDLAAKEPECDWRISIQGPLSGRTYQRHGPGLWVLVAANRGFA